MELKVHDACFCHDFVVFGWVVGMEGDGCLTIQEDAISPQEAERGSLKRRILPARGGKATSISTRHLFLGRR